MRLEDLESNKLEKEYSQMLFDVKYDKEQFKDPEIIGLLLFRLVKERDASNKMFKEILSSLSQINDKLAGEPRVQQQEVQQLLSEIDQKIVAFAREKGQVDAEVLQTEFSYKGKNAASARLNALYKLKLLQKGRAGKKVYYWVEGMQPATQ